MRLQDRVANVLLVGCLGALNLGVGVSLAGTADAEGWALAVLALSLGGGAVAWALLETTRLYLRLAENHRWAKSGVG